MQQITKQAEADRSVKAYDAFIFSSFGRPFDGGKADVLAFVAADACSVASRDRAVNQVTRQHYAILADQFRLIA